MSRIGKMLLIRLKKLREKRNISQLKLALDLCINQNSISRYENGQREADCFQGSIDYLLEEQIIPKQIDNN